MISATTAGNGTQRTRPVRFISTGRPTRGPRSKLGTTKSMRIFRKLTNQDLIEKGRRKPSGERKEPRTPYPALPSIEFRPEHINSREELGHKEIDLIVGCKGSRAAVLTIADRKCREEMGFRIPDKKAASVRAVFDRLERKLGKRHQRERKPAAAQILSQRDQL